MGDKTKLKEAIFNLIDNAIKYTPEGGQITVSLYHKTKDASTKLAIIKIQDTGIGMEEEDIQSLFQPFSRSQTAIHTHTEGKGLGLFIAKKFIEDHKGKITVYSEGRNQGSTFTIELPVQ